MLDDERRLLRMEDESLDDLAGNDTLFGVQERRGLVEQIYADIRLAEREDDSDTLELSSRERLDVLVDDVLEVHRLDDVGLELRVHKRRLDLLEQQHADRARELGRDRLRLERHCELLAVCLDVGRVAREQAHERRLAGTVLAKHDDDLRVGEAAGLDSELEAAESLRHGRVLVVAGLIHDDLLRSLDHLE